MNIKFGADPEYFIARNLGDNFVCVPPLTIRRNGYKIVKEDEKHPQFAIVSGIGGDIIVHEDGAAFELSVPPATSLRIVWENCKIGQEKIEEIGKEFGFVFQPIPTINFDTNEFREDLEGIYCTRFGCDKDFDAWQMQIEQMEEDASEHPYRYGGGHIHTSVIDSFILRDSPVPAIKILGLTVGNFISSVSPHPQLDFIRTYRYGRPGRFRPQRYPDGTFGVEYRTPSNAWTTIKDGAVIDEIEFWIKIGLERLLPDVTLSSELIDELRDRTFKAILECNQDLAKENIEIIKGALHL